MNRRRALAAGATLLLSAGGICSPARAGSITANDVALTWLALTWLPGNCIVVPFTWSVTGYAGTVSMSTRDASGRAVDLSGGRWPSTRDVYLGYGEQGATGTQEVWICGPADQQAAHGMRVWLSTERYVSGESVTTSASTELYEIVQDPPPGPPTGVTAAVSDRDAMVSWSPPRIRPELVAGYEVKDAATGETKCALAPHLLRCSFGKLLDGPHSFAVVAVNSSGISSAATVSSTFTVGPPMKPSPPAIRLRNGRIHMLWQPNTQTTAVPVRFVVRNQRMAVICTVKWSPSDLARNRAGCTTEGRKGDRYQLTVVTRLGSATSDASTPLN